MNTEQPARFVYLATPRTLENGQDVRPSLDVNGNIIVSGSSSGGGIPITQQTVTNHQVSLAASTPQVIPSGAKGYFIAILTGTASIGTATALPAGFSVGDSNTLAASITVTTDSASTAAVFWNT